MKTSAVLIPIYKTIPDLNEEISFKQCLKILYKHPICIFTYKGLDISFYTKKLDNDKITYWIEYFDKKYFEDIQGYNRLMMSFHYYNRFKEFVYILIYQLDAYVFRDELEYWCRKEYDYIGAPWFENYGTHENNNNLWAVGNGGFSLRRIDTFLNVLKFKKPLYPCSELNKIYPKGKNLNSRILRFIKILIKSCGYKNNSYYFSKQFIENEDAFWSIFLQKSRRPIKIPKYEEAIQFSFEKSPQFLFEINDNKLPFGCHAWAKYDFDNFWKKFIIENDNSQTIYNYNQPQQ